MPIPRSSRIAVCVVLAAASAGTTAGTVFARGATDAEVRLDAASAPAKLVSTCDRHRRATRRNCGPVAPPSRRPPELTLRPAATIELKVPAHTKRLLVNVGEFGSDYARVKAVAARPVSAGRTLWRAKLPSKLTPRTNWIYLVATAPGGKQRSYFAAAASDEEDATG